MPTQAIGSFNDAQGQEVVRFEIDYDGANRITALRCINSSNQAAYAEIIRASDGRKYGARFAPGNTNIQVPTGITNRIVISFDQVRGRPLGFDRAFLWPYP